MSANLALVAAEDSVAMMIGESFAGADRASSLSAGAAMIAEPTKFEFLEEYQTKIAALVVRDNIFMKRAAHLLRPEFFENVGEAALVGIAISHFEKYGEVPSIAVMPSVFKASLASGVIRKDMAQLIGERWRVVRDASLSDRNYIEEKLLEFVRHQAVGQAILASIPLIEAKKFEKVETLIKTAVNIGLNEEGEVSDYFSDKRIEARTSERADRLSGKLVPQGITTGIHRMDEALHHRGWGRKELATIMGGAKSGKTTALINFAQAAALRGHNVIYVTLEVSKRIVEERLDACITSTLMKELDRGLHTVEAKLKGLQAKSGKLNIVEMPSGSMSPAMLTSLLEKHRDQGITYDLVVVDYADIMKPNFRTDNVIENSKSVYIDLRAVAFEFNVAMLTATQTNREGHKATIAKAEHVSEDFNKVRTVDLMISINKTEEEAKLGQARLYFAASRNQESGFTIRVQQNLAMMKFVESIIGVE